MSQEERKPYSSKRWTDIPRPKVIGYTEFTEEEKAENDKKIEQIMRTYGVLKANEHIRNGKVIKNSTT